MKITEFKVYPVRPSGYQFHGNQWTNTRNVKNVADKISTKVGAAGDIADGLEMYTLMKNGEAKKLAEKNGEFIGTKIGDAGAAKMVGKCTKSLFTAKSPSGVALKGIICAGSGFAIHTLGKNVGEISGKTDIYTEVVVGLIEADRIITEEEDKAMEEYYQKYPEERH
jgi:hypothetical protein